MIEFLVVAGCLTILQVIIQPHAWKLFVRGLRGNETDCHEYKVCYNTLDASIGKPWCYRVLSAWIVLVAHKVFKNLFVALVLIRYLQNYAILVLFKKYALCYGVYNRAVVAAVLLAIIIGYANTDFRLNTHNETILLLLSFLLPTWALIPIALLAALNRETYGLFYLVAFPLFGLSYTLLIALGVFCVTTIIVRMLIYTEKLTCPQFTPGWALVKRNLADFIGLPLNIATYFGLVLVDKGDISKLSVSIFLMGAVNFIANLWYGNIRETALFINPYILLIPLIA